MAAAGLETFSNMPDDALVSLEADPHDFRDGFPGQIILGRAQAAANDHGVAAGESCTQGVDNTLVIVTHFGLQKRVDSCQGELLTHPGRIGVMNVAEQQLGSDSDDFATQALFSL